MLDLADIPLYQMDDPDELLGLGDWTPDKLDDFWQHGWGWVINLNLNELPVNRALVWLLHSTTHPPKQEDDIEIGFYLDNEDIPYLTEEIESRASLNKFLSLRLQEIIDELEIPNLILCVCNPHGAMIERPKEIPENVNVYFPKGVVYHWKHIDFEDVVHYELEAEEWVQL